MSNAALQAYMTECLNTPARMGDDIIFVAEVYRQLYGRDFFPGLPKPIRRFSVLRQLVTYGRHAEKAIASFLDDRGFFEYKAGFGTEGDVGVVINAEKSVTLACWIPQGWLMRSTVGICVRTRVNRCWHYAA